MNFDKQFVYFDWDESLICEKVFAADNIRDLRALVREGHPDERVVVKGKWNDTYPFDTSLSVSAFVYHDPWYELKLAYEQGKTIQIFEDDVWCDYLDPTSWSLSPEAYRVKPEAEPVTNRELARWLAHGKGEALLPEALIVVQTLEYRSGTEDKVSNDIKIRKWTDTEWHTPTREYMGLE